MDADPAATLRDFNVSLDSIEAALAPLLTRPLNETREGLDAIQRAKLDVLVAYTINNLLWSESGHHLGPLPQLTAVYLKTRGIDPDTHAVAKELVSSVSYIVS